MTAREFYKSVLSKIYPLYLLALFLPGVFYSVFFKKELLVKFIILSISIIIIVETAISLFRTIRIILKKKIQGKKNGVILFLVIIPYFPSIFGTFVYYLSVLFTDDFVDRFLLTVILAINLTINFIFAMYVNTKINTFRFLGDDK